jgi:hypothetical protein
MAERRSSKRISAHLKVWCEHEELTLLTTTVSLAKNGLFLRSSRPFEAGTALVLTIEELGMVAHAEVRCCLGTRCSQQPGIGVELVRFERGAVAYERYLEQNASRSGEHRLHL